MDTRTGEIRRFTAEEFARLTEAERRHLLAISEKDADELAGMNRHDRRRWAVDKRREERRARRAAARA